VGFLQRLGRIVAVIGVAHQRVTQAQREDCFRQIGSERDDAPNGLGNPDGAASFVGDLLRRSTASGGCGRLGRSGACGQQREQGYSEREGAKSKNLGAPGCDPCDSGFACHRSGASFSEPALPIKKAPQKEWGSRPHPFSRRVSVCYAVGGCPDLRPQGPIHSGGTVADFHGLPPSSQACKIVEEEFRRGLSECQPGDGETTIQLGPNNAPSRHDQLIACHSGAESVPKPHLLTFTNCVAWTLVLDENHVGKRIASPSDEVRPAGFLPGDFAQWQGQLRLD
jgi:hypothetical protein